MMEISSLSTVTQGRANGKQGVRYYLAVPGLEQLEKSDLMYPDIICYDLDIYQNVDY
jgi:hypothetical protein